MRVKKAKVFAEEYRAAVAEGKTSAAAMTNVLTDMISEIPIIVEARRARRRDAVGAVVREQIDKWHAFIRRIEDAPAMSLTFAAVLENLMTGFWNKLPEDVREYCWKAPR